MMSCKTPLKLIIKNQRNKKSKQMNNETLDNETFNIFCNILSEKMKEFHIVEKNIPSGQWEHMHTIYKKQLEQIWRDEFVEMYKTGHIIDILIEWEKWEKQL